MEAETVTDSLLETANPATEVFSVISDDGSRDPATDPGLDAQKLLHIYRSMVELRAADERCMQLQRTGRIGFYVPHGGEEAAQIGIAAALRDEDWIFPSYRNQGILTLRGTELNHMIAQLYGNHLDLSKGRQMPNHYAFAAQRFVSISSPIGTQIVQATGTAMAMRIKGSDLVTATWFGDGSTSSSDFHTGLNFAGVFKAPVVFVCTNNGWAISMPLEKQTASETLAVKAQAYGMPGIRVDGNDALACYAVMRDAAERARAGQGPTLIEAVTFRMGPHTSSDDPSRYRDPALSEEWGLKDPIKRLERVLEADGILAPGEAEKIYDQAKEKIQASVDAMEPEPAPDPDTIFEDVYEESTAQLLEQRDELRAEIEASRGQEAEDEGQFPL